MVPRSSPSIRTLISVVVAMPSGSSENDVGAYHNPKCVVADEGDFDEYPHDCEPRKNERERQSKIHYASPLRCNRNSTVSVQCGRDSKQTFGRYSAYEFPPRKNNPNQLNDLFCCSLPLYRTEQTSGITWQY